MSVTLASAAGSLFARALRRPHRRRPVHDRRLRHLPGPVRRGHLHRQGPATTSTRSARRSTGACPRTRSSRTTCSRASTRAPRSSSDVEVVDDYPGERARARARASTAGCAATGRSCCWLLALGADAHGLRAQPPAARSAAGRSSTTCGAAWSRPAYARAARRGAGRCCPGRPSALDARRRSRCWRSRSARRCSRVLAGPRAAAAARRVRPRAPARSSQTALAQALARPDASSPTTRGEMVHAIVLTLVPPAASRSGACSSGRPRPPSPRARPASRARRACARSSSRCAASPRRRARARCAGRSRCVRDALAGGAAVPAAVGRRAARRVLAQPPGAARGDRRARRRRARRSCAGIARRTLALLRDVRGEPRTTGSPPDNFQEEPGPDAWRTAPRRPTSAWACSSTLAAHDLGYIGAADAGRSASNETLDTLESARAPRGAPAQLVRHPHAGAAAAALRLDGRQRQPRGRADRARPGAAAAWRTAASDGPHAAAGSRHGGPLLSARRSRPRRASSRCRTAGPRAGSRHVVHQLHERGADAAEARRRVPLGDAVAAALRWRDSGRARPARRREAALRPARRAISRAALDALLATRSASRTPRLRCAADRARRARRGVRRRRWTSAFLYDATAPALLDRLPARRRRGPGTARRLVLRPARLGGAPRELPRDREGRRAAGALVPARPRRSSSVDGAPTLRLVERHRCSST